jgi:small subunit ribosomal protein S1
MNRTYLPEGRLINTIKNRKILSNPKALQDAANHQTIVEAMAITCDTEHNITVNLGCMQGVIPRAEGAIGIAEGIVRDIALISRVGKPVSFIITDFSTNREGKQIAILSRRKAQEKCKNEYLSSLLPGDIIPAKVTHLENFGAFCDIGCGCVALLPIDTISVSRIAHPSDRFDCGDDIKTVVKSIVDGKITLSMKELLGTWQENADCFSQGETVSGIVRSVENYGIFVELTPNLAGLAENKSGVTVGQEASVYIKSILPEKMKVKLIIIDSFSANNPKLPIKYFCNEPTLSAWRYSPDCCSKIVGSVF